MPSDNVTIYLAVLKSAFKKVETVLAPEVSEPVKTLFLERTLPSLVNSTISISPLTVKVPSTVAPKAEPPLTSSNTTPPLPSALRTKPSAILVVFRSILSTTTWLVLSGTPSHVPINLSAVTLPNALRLPATVNLSLGVAPIPRLPRNIFSLPQMF